MNRHWISRIALSLILATSVTSACATDEALLQILLKNKSITQEQYDALKKTGQEKQPATGTVAAKRLPAQDEGLVDLLLANGVITQEQYAALQVKNADEKAKKQEAGEAKVTLADGLKFKSADGDFQAQVSMYAQLDAATYSDNKTDYADGAELRRARLSLSGTVLKDWDYKMEADFAGVATSPATNDKPGTSNSVVVTDAYLRYNGFRPASITAGNFKVPFSLEAVSSGKYLTFMERGLPFAFLNLRSLGGMVSTNGDNWTVAAGLFGDTVTQQNNDDEGWGTAGRITFAPWFQKDRVLHLGFSGQYRVPDANGDNKKALQTVRFRSKPESDVIMDDLSGTGSLGRLVDTGSIAGDVNDYALLGVEAAGVYGPASLQGEYIRATVGRVTKNDLAFDGYYIYGSYFLTGDIRNYKADKGVFDIIQPAKPFKLHGDGWGAWELATRYSALDLNDADVKGGEERNVTVGLNWYPNSFVRLMANYVHVLDINSGKHNNEDLDVFQVRTQVAY